MLDSQAPNHQRQKERGHYLKHSLFHDKLLKFVRELR